MSIHLLLIQEIPPGEELYIPEKVQLIKITDKGNTS